MYVFNSKTQFTIMICLTVFTITLGTGAWYQPPGSCTGDQLDPSAMVTDDMLARLEATTETECLLKVHS